MQIGVCVFFFSLIHLPHFANMLFVYFNYHLSSKWLGMWCEYLFVCACFLHSSACRFNGWEFFVFMVPNLFRLIFKMWKKRSKDWMIKRDTWRKKMCKNQITLRYNIVFIVSTLSYRLLCIYINRSHSHKHEYKFRNVSFCQFHFICFVLFSRTFWIENFDSLSSIAFHDMFARPNVWMCRFFLYLLLLT